MMAAIVAHPAREVQCTGLGELISHANGK